MSVGHLENNPNLPGSPIGNFSWEEATHAGVFKLENGAELTVAISPAGFFIGADVAGQISKIAFSHEAMEVILSVLIGRRDLQKPLPMCELIAFSRKVQP